MPGLGLQPFLLSSSSDICCPFISFFDNRKRIRNERKPLMSQHDFFISVNCIIQRIKRLLFMDISDNRYV